MTVLRVYGAARPSRLRESQIEKELNRRIVEHHGLTRKLRWLDRRGAPDRFVVLNNRVFLVEVKAPGEKPRPEQLREHQRLKAHGVRVVTIDNTDGIDYLLRLAFEDI